MRRSGPSRWPSQTEPGGACRSDNSYRRPLTPTPVAGPPLRDPTIAPGERWCYVVRTVASTEPVVESASSGEACVENKDVFPPAAPGGVAVLVRDDGVRDRGRSGRQREPRLGRRGGPTPLRA